ncbi:MAG: CoA transferase [Alphaproteobacteria bacterium]|nr:MAG: CoA transferase [Alphaproteobacteria bacterium]
MNKEGALSGIKVIDLTRVISGPFCTLLLADMGAEVIKIEPPKGDNVRNQGEFVDGYSSYFAQFNRNKKSVVLDLYQNDDKEKLKLLLKNADVIVDNFRPGVLAKMGLDSKTLTSINSRLIQASVNGFGSTGQYSQRPAFDFIAQAISGFMSLNGSEKTGPVRTAAPISDLIAGLYCAFGIVTAINARHNTKKGQVVETSLTSSLISLMAYLSAEYFVTDKPPKKSGNDHPILSPYGLFKTKDGNIAIAPANDKLCSIFLRTLNLEHLLEDDLYKTNSLRMINRDKLNDIINKTTELNTTDYWIEKLNQSGCPAGKVLDMKEALNDQLVEDTDMVIVSDGPDNRKIKMTGFPVKLSDTPAQLFRSPPKLGEHTKEILSKIKN